MQTLELYRYFAEDAHDRYIFFYTYEENIDNVVAKLEGLIGHKAHIYDLFPGVHSEKIIAEEPLSVITKDGQEMFLPVGMEITVFDRQTILLGEAEEECLTKAT